MGLPRAILAHKKGDFQEASQHYQRALQQNSDNPAIYQNYGALLKKFGHEAEAHKIYQKGLQKFPDHPGILRNFANLNRDENPIFAVELYFKIASILIQNPAFDKDDLFKSVCDDLVEMLYNLKLHSWCLLLIKKLVAEIDQLSPNIFKYLVLLAENDDDLSHETKSLIQRLSRSLVESESLLDVSNLDFALASHCLKKREFEDAYKLYSQAITRIHDSSSIIDSHQEDLQRSIDCNSWNFACACLPLGKLDPGWKLFEFGLRTPADGPQKWQRALPKPFSSNELPLWRGQMNDNFKLLLLEEQAIGDVMMFLTLLPSFIKNFAFVGVYLSERLLTIYERSFSVDIRAGRLKFYTKKDLSANTLKAQDFDYQSPIGSICQYCFTDFKQYSQTAPVLMSEQKLSDKLRDQYLGVGQQKELLIGISWKGGGRGPRIKQKSIEPDQFGRLMLSAPSVRFIDLQYGDTQKQISKWKEMDIDVIHDDNINPLKDMDSWLAQVDACDAVLSVANTTIHGAGGLNKPTLCLLSIYSDWRWLVSTSISRSYWYPSVGIARQSSEGAWDDAFSDVYKWMQEKCPMPTGPCC